MAWAAPWPRFGSIAWAGVAEQRRLPSRPGGQRLQEHDRLVAGQRHCPRRGQATDPGADDHDPWYAGSISAS
jgi:hypothetical protein